MLARRSPVPIEVALDTAGRLPEAVEIAGYYVVSEALTNATKHADATAISVTVEADAEDHVLRIAVRDDGVGGADFTHGTGLVGLKDRVEALGGRILLDSTPAPARGCAQNSRSLPRKIASPPVELVTDAHERSRASAHV